MRTKLVVNAVTGAVTVATRPLPPEEQAGHTAGSQRIASRRAAHAEQRQRAAARAAVLDALIAERGGVEAVLASVFPSPQEAEKRT